MSISAFYKKYSSKINKKRATVGAGILLLVFLLVNAATFAYFYNRAYPGTTVGKYNLGNKSFFSIEKHPISNFVPTAIEISSGSQKNEVKLESLGIELNKHETIVAIKKERALLPLVNLFKREVVQPSIKFDKDKLKKEADRLSAGFYKAPKDAAIVLQEGIFNLTPAEQGGQVTAEVLASKIKAAVLEARTKTAVTTQTLAPKKQTQDLKPAYESLKAQQSTEITYTYLQKSSVVTPQIMGGWFVPAANSYQLSDSQIRSHLVQLGKSWGITIDNLDSAASETKKAVLASKKLSFALTARKVSKSYTYCTAHKGVDSSYHSEFMSKLAAVYGSARGWSLDNRVVYNRGTSGCHFTVWLSAASQVPSFGGVCESSWSCRMGNNVVINFDRWQSATTAWNSAGGGLDDYRTMVINHETGHWFGFGHKHCSGAGQLAPVMQQQSIDLEGCKFNPWPLASETSALKSSLGI